MSGDNFFQICVVLMLFLIALGVERIGNNLKNRDTDQNK